MASISEQGGRWIVQFKGTNGKRRTISLGQMTERHAQRVKGHIEELVAAAATRCTPRPETVTWLAELDDVMRGKLADVGLASRRKLLTLGEFLDGYIASRTDVKPSTQAIYAVVRQNLVDHFGTDKPLREITVGDAKRWTLALKARQPHKRGKGKPTKDTKMAPNTVLRRCSIAKQFFAAAVHDQQIGVNPFAGEGGVVKGNRERLFYVDRETAQKAIEACPDAEWRLIVALSRYGGFRCPSEHLALTWADVNWEHERMVVRSPKTEAHEGKESRVVPIFPELRQYLEDVQALAGDSPYVITRYRDTRQNLRTQFKRILRKAGLTPWPKLFQNMRSTRETELADTWPGHVVCAWIGNSQAVAREHYLQVTDEHFKAATQAGSALHGALQHRHEIECDEVRAQKSEVPAEAVTPAFAEDCTRIHPDASLEVFGGSGLLGLEPRTF